MPLNVLILGASYGSLLSTKILMAGHNVTLVCRRTTAELIDSRGTIVRITRRGESTPDEIHSQELPGKLSAKTPLGVDPFRYDLIAIAMQEPQLRAPEVSNLLWRIGTIDRPCLSIMNMPAWPYLWRIPAIDAWSLRGSYTQAKVWDDFHPDRVSLCSPDPQAFRPPGEPLNLLHVGLPTNFKAVGFSDPNHTAVLKRLESDIAAARFRGNEVPVKLRVQDSLFVPLAKWSMLIAGNYRSITADGPRSISEAIHSDLEASREIYNWVNHVLFRLGGPPEDQVPFEKYASVARGLVKPSSVARAVFANAHYVERVDRLVMEIGKSLNMSNHLVDENVKLLDQLLETNRGRK